MLRHAIALGLISLASLAAPTTGSAEVTHIDITARTDVLNGTPFPPTGPYEKITATAQYTNDPHAPANRRIVDLDFAPRAPDGLVHYSAAIEILAPKDPTKSNQIALIDVLNRGRKNLPRDFNRGTGSTDLNTAADYGDGFLMHQGFTTISLGWQFDIPHKGGLLGLDAPPVLINGKLVTGPVTTRFVTTTAETTHRLDDLGRYADTTHYPPVDLTAADSKLTIRTGYLAKPTLIPRQKWQFAREADGKLVPDANAIYLEGGFTPGAIYELSYQGTGAVVAGLGFAALRDLAAYLKTDQPTLPKSRATIAFGPSQDGRYLRQFLYQGFNADEHGGRALDGIIANIAGSSRTADINTRFARPNGLGFFDGALFPYLDARTRDPITGKTDGVQKSLKPSQQPKIFYTNSSGEYWGGGRAAALTHTSLDGQRDVSPPPNVRIYLFAGTQHIPGGFLPSQGQGAQPPNPNEQSWALRALLVAMKNWVLNDTPPPPSAHPTLAAHTLVPAANIAFPAIPTVHTPRTIPAGYRADLPNGEAHKLPLLVTDVDKDGNERAGIRLPMMAVPLGTYTGWNFRSAKIGAPEELLPLTGSFIVFPKTPEARATSADPRPSIAERYDSRADYEAKIRATAEALAKTGYVLTNDIPTIVAVSLAQWDSLTAR